MNYDYDADHIRLASGIELSPELAERVKNFFKEVERLKEASWVKEGMHAGVTIKWGGEAEKTETHFRDWEQMESVLMRMRPFILKKEASNFNNIRSQVNRIIREKLGSIVGSNFANAVKHQTRGFEGYSKDEGVTVSGFGNISSREFLMNYLNADVYHRNEKIVELISPALKMDETELKGFLSLTIFSMTNAIFILRDIIWHVLSEKDRKLLA